MMLVASLARQIGDAEHFKEARIASWGELSTAARIDIARVYLETGEVDTAHSWLKEIPETETFQSDEREKLLLEIYREKGLTQELAGSVSDWKKFKNHDTFKDMIVQAHGRKRSFWSKYETKSRKGTRCIAK